MNQNTNNVDVLAVMDRAIDNLQGAGVIGNTIGMREARAAVAEFIGKADAVAGTLEMPTLVKQSTKNPNAGFIDWRDWCALQGEVSALRAALARVGGAK